MQLLPLALEQRVVGGILHQRVLEGVGGIRRRAAAIDQPGLGQLARAPPRAVRRCSAEMRASSSYENSRPMHAPIWTMSFTGARRSSRASSESRSEVGMASDGQRGLQRVLIARLAQQSRLEHRLGQLLDKQRHPVGVRHDLLEHLRRQRPALRHLGDQLGPLAPPQAAQAQRGDMRLFAPGQPCTRAGR